MKINDKFEVTVWGILVLIGGVATVVAPATWGIAKLTEANELEAYRRAKDWKVADAIASLSELSKVTKLDAEERKELVALRGHKQQFDKTTTELREQVTKLQNDRDLLRQTLASMVKTADTLEIPLGEARFVLANTLAVGVVSLSSASKRCDIQSGSRSQGIYVGQSIVLPYGGRDYSLTLLKLDDRSCTFSFAESPRR
jgi:hypothetical protein